MNKLINTIDKSQIEIVWKGGVFGIHEYEAKYKGVVETLRTSARPEQGELIRDVFADIYSQRDSV